MGRLYVAAAFAALVACATAVMPTGYQEGTWGEAGCRGGSTGCCCDTLRRNSGAATCTDVEQILCQVQKRSNAARREADEATTTFKNNGDRIWIIQCGALVFFMQCGFAMLEAGSIRQRNTQNIIFKNAMDACIAGVTFYLIGYALAFDDGGDDAGDFIGETNFVLSKEKSDESGMPSFFFQFAFAATAATIVSGAVAERTKVVAYFIYSIVLTGFIYPVVVHWVWSSSGFLSAFAESTVRIGRNGMIDFAGSGVVHTVGGFAGLCGTIVLGPRHGRFEVVEGESGCSKYGDTKEIRGQSMMLACLGALILWFGWYGFNCGSTLAWDGANAGKVATCTTLGAAFGGLGACLMARILQGHYAIDVSLNGVLAGLVSVTAGCAVIDEWGAVVIGLVGGVLMYGTSELLLCLKIDDPLNAFPVHGACGVWGCLAVGIFARGRNIRRAYSGLDEGAVDSGDQFIVQLAGLGCIIAWTVGLCLLMFVAIDKTVGMRISAEQEDMGMDACEHGMDPTRSFQLRKAQKEEAVEPYGDEKV
eukprot:TRINITY_DN14216_c1_g1_i2.p1 TRINITY_DN14216_c1_g1~~TRINITY_DN14216_c1_g1_i2.p1  ORF type:complete len:564 (+),score=210.17 TRINITY_DN14216_c1_g1_i2:94-1692(+)